MSVFACGLRNLDKCNLRATPTQGDDATSATGTNTNAQPLHEVRIPDFVASRESSTTRPQHEWYMEHGMPENNHLHSTMGVTSCAAVSSGDLARHRSLDWRNNRKAWQYGTLNGRHASYCAKPWTITRMSKALTWQATNKHVRRGACRCDGIKHARNKFGVAPLPNADSSWRPAGVVKIKPLRVATSSFGFLRGRRHDPRSEIPDHQIRHRRFSIVMSYLSILIIVASRRRGLVSFLVVARVVSASSSFTCRTTRYRRHSRRRHCASPVHSVPLVLILL